MSTGSFASPRTTDIWFGTTLFHQRTKGPLDMSYSPLFFSRWPSISATQMNSAPSVINHWQALLAKIMEESPDQFALKHDQNHQQENILLPSTVWPPSRKWTKDPLIIPIKTDELSTQKRLLSHMYAYGGLNPSKPNFKASHCFSCRPDGVNTVLTYPSGVNRNPNRRTWNGQMPQSKATRYHREIGKRLNK